MADDSEKKTGDGDGGIKFPEGGDASRGEGEPTAVEGAAEGAGGQDVGTGEITPPVRKPAIFAGFLQRLAAVLADIVLIYFTGYTLEMAFREQLLRIGPANLLFASHVAVFIYLWLANGPIGKGMTLGKAVLNIRVVDENGKPIGLGASFRRTLLQYSLLLPAFGIFIANFDVIPTVSALVFTQALHHISLALLLMLAYTVIVHPQRRGWHDLWARDFVATNPATSSFHETVHTPFDDEARQRMTVQRRTALIFLGVIVVVLGFQLLMSARETVANPAIGLIEKLEAEAPLPHYSLESTGLLDGQSAKIFEDYLHGAPFPTADDLTTATQTVSEGPWTLRLIYTRSQGSADVAEAGNPEFQSDLQALRRAIQVPFAEFARAVDAPTTSPQNLLVLFADRFPFMVFYSMGGDQDAGGLRLEWFAHGPLDPEQGPLEYARATPAGRKRAAESNAHPTQSDTETRSAP